jgi:pimeloyl-ACP methyl ester carboxylesterase
MVREVHYCATEDGVRIAYCVEGEGPPLLAVPFFLESFSLDHLVPEYVDVLRRLSRGRRLIRFDTRGTGLSDRHVGDMSLEALRLDIDAVVRGLGLDRLSLLGPDAVGGIRAIDYAAWRSSLVDRLVLYQTWCRVRDGIPPATLQGFIQLARSAWEVAVRAFADLGGRRHSDEMGLRLAEMYRQSMTGEIAAKLMESNSDVDLTPVLPKVTAETLVLHRLSDPYSPISLAHGVAAGIPKARLVALQGHNLSLWIDSEDLVEATVAFLEEGLPAIETQLAEKQGPLRAVLITDLAGSTEMMSRLGDEKGREVLREHERITRGVLAAHGGVEVEDDGRRVHGLLRKRHEGC